MKLRIINDEGCELTLSVDDISEDLIITYSR